MNAARSNPRLPGDDPAPYLEPQEMAVPSLQEPGPDNRASEFLTEIIRLAGLELTVRLKRQQKAGLVDDIVLHVDGPDLKSMVCADGELQRAMEHLATELLRLHPNTN